MNWAPNFGEEEPNIEGAVYQALGAASLCWEDMSSTGVFQSDEATRIAEGLLRFIADREAIIRAEAEADAQLLLSEDLDAARADVARLNEQYEATANAYLDEQERAEALRAEVATLREQIATAIEEFADDWADWDAIVKAGDDICALRDVVKDAIHNAAAIARGDSVSAATLTEEVTR